MDMPKWMKRDDKLYYIYALVDPRNHKTRYIGISNDAQLRYDQHINGGSNKQVWRWIYELKSSGKSPVLQVLETVYREGNSSFIDFMEVVHAREAHWIDTYRDSGALLLNIRGITAQHAKIIIGQRKLVGGNTATNSQAVSRAYSHRMRLEDFRIDVAVLTRQQLATIADVSISSLQRAEEGKPVSRLTQSRILKGLSQHLGRAVTREEIDEFR
jgi:hypothetical protein